MKTAWRKCWWSCLVVSFITGVSSAAGVVSGRLVTETGPPLGNTRVSLHLRSELSQFLAPGRLPTPSAALVAGFNVTAITSPGGQFSFSGVPSGSLQFCVTANDLLIYDACLWNPTENRFELPTGRDKDLGTIVAKRGHLLSINIADPEGLLPTKGPGEKQGLLSEQILVMIRNPVLGYLPLSAQVVAGARRFEIVVPFDLEFSLKIDSGGLALTDGKSRRASGLTRLIKISRTDPKNPNFQVGRPSTVPAR